MTKRNIVVAVAVLTAATIWMAFAGGAFPSGQSHSMSASAATSAEDNSKVVSVTESSYAAEVLNSDIPVIIDFGAPWCPPCRAMEPVFKDVSAEYRGKVKFVKVNTDNDPALARAYSVSGIPALVLIKKDATGKLVYVKSTGGRGDSGIRSFIKDGLDPNANTTPVPVFPQK